MAVEDWIETGYADILQEEEETRMAKISKDRGALGHTKKAKHAAEDDSVGYRLPTSQTEPVSSLSDCITLIYGTRKIGKTSMAAAAPKNLVLATEVGYRGLRLTKEDITSWARARAVEKALRKDKTFRMITVDTADKLYRLSEVTTCRELDVEELADAEWGRGYSANRKRFDDYLTSLSRLGKGLILISHAMEQVIRQRNGPEFDRTMPTMAKQAREIVEPMVDIWGCYQYLESRRVLTIAGTEHISAGHRFAERFRTPSGDRLRHIHMGRSGEEAWQNFTDAFHNRFTPPKSEDVIRRKRKLKK